MGGAPRFRGQGGFALVEVVLALLLIALIAALAMPGLARGTGPASLRVAAMNVSALLRQERNRAIESGQPSTIVATGSSVRVVGASRTVAMPPGADAGPHGGAIRFEADGRASGARLDLRSAAGIFVINADPSSGAIDVSGR